MSPIPWAAILRHGPTLVAAASRLVAREHARRHPTGDDSAETRLESLEHSSHESARLLQDLAQQVQALTLVQEETARRVRFALALAIAGLALALAALVLAFARS